MGAAEGLRGHRLGEDRPHARVREPAPRSRRAGVRRGAVRGLRRAARGAAGHPRRAARAPPDASRHARRDEPAPGQQRLRHDPLVRHAGGLDRPARRRSAELLGCDPAPDPAPELPHGRHEGRRLAAVREHPASPLHGADERPRPDGPLLRPALRRPPRNQGPRGQRGRLGGRPRSRAREDLGRVAADLRRGARPRRRALLRGERRVRSPPGPAQRAHHRDRRSRAGRPDRPADGDAGRSQPRSPAARVGQRRRLRELGRDRIRGARARAARRPSTESWSSTSRPSTRRRSGAPCSPTSGHA